MTAQNACDLLLPFPTTTRRKLMKRLQLILGALLIALSLATSASASNQVTFKLTAEQQLLEDAPGQAEHPAVAFFSAYFSVSSPCSSR